MIPIGATGGQVEVYLYAQANRLVLVVGNNLLHVWLTADEADAIAANLGLGSRELRRRKEEIQR